jgi:hypothetical protein
MSKLHHPASAWLPEKAARYANNLIGLKGKGYVSRFSSGSVGEVIFDDKLSERLLLSLKMKDVWDYLREFHDEQDWYEFLGEAQFAAQGPCLKVSPTDKADDMLEISGAFKSINRISKRYGIDVTKMPVGRFFDRPEIDSMLNEPADWHVVRGGTEITLKQYCDELTGLIDRQQVLVKKPQHQDILYQFFVRRIYLFFKKFSKQPNQWKVLSIIASVSLEMKVSPTRVRGSCKDLV